MKNNFKAIIFDRDGIIINSEPINLSSAIKAFKKQGIEITEDEKKIIIGTHPRDYQDIFEKKYPDLDFTEYREYKRKLYVKGQKTAPLFAETIKLIKKLYQQKTPLALVTSSSGTGTLDILKRAGIDNLFKTIVTFEDCEKRKPAPDCYLIAAKKLGLKPSDCLVFEDTQIGLEAAKQAGMTCYVIPTQTTKNQDFSKADKVIEDKGVLSELL
jgi:HAD superfamily hydrolase (TIGR01509 family)